MHFPVLAAYKHGHRELQYPNSFTFTLTRFNDYSLSQLISILSFSRILLFIELNFISYY